ncbi:MAG: SH3 domain-containing protein, partial [Chloroflexota bacterium]
IEVTRYSPTQMGVASTFYAKDGSCTLSNSATWSFASSSPQPQPPPPQSGCTVTPISSVSVLNKRSGPGLNYSVVGQLLRGSYASVTNVSYDTQGRRWWLLSDNAWVSAAYTTAQGSCPA